LDKTDARLGRATIEDNGCCCSTSGPWRERALTTFSAAPPATKGWTEERVVVVGFVLLAFLAGLIIFIASFFDSLT
jgi:hypothetical protein